MARRSGVFKPARKARGPYQDSEIWRINAPIDDVGLLDAAAADVNSAQMQKSPGQNPGLFAVAGIKASGYSLDMPGMRRSSVAITITISEAADSTAP
jgi:hypothetical protein